MSGGSLEQLQLGAAVWWDRYLRRQRLQVCIIMVHIGLLFGFYTVPIVLLLGFFSLPIVLLLGFFSLPIVLLLKDFCNKYISLVGGGGGGGGAQ